MDDHVLREFLAEAEDLLEILFGDLQALRVRHREGRARRELVGRIFRHIHTLKGSSATVELKTVTELAHEFESLLDGVRLGRVAGLSESGALPDFFAGGGRRAAEAGAELVGCAAGGEAA